MRYLRYLITAIVLSLFIAVPCFASDKTYDVKYYDGSTIQVSDDYLDELIENIKKVDGQQAADAYIQAMKNGSYADFYAAVNNTTETCERAEYMQINGQDLTGQHLTMAQTIESNIQTIYGPSGTVEKTGQAAVDAGFEASEDGFTNYWVAILLEEATRPEDATNPTYRASEIRAVMRSNQDLEYADQGIIVDYPDEPLSDEAKKLAEQFNYQVKPAEEIYSAEELQKIQEEAASEITQDDSQLNNIEATPIQSDVTVVTPKQFALAALIIVILAIAITTCVMIIVHHKRK